jgi:prophage antirepressor-like protein
MTNIILFNFENNDIRFIGTAENPEWVAEDICKALDLENTSQAVTTLKSNESRITNVDTRSENGVEQSRQMLVVNESGLYRLIFKSRKPAAERMRNWVFSEVLPSIRKTGSYSIVPSQPQLPSRELAVETAVAIDRIQDILSKSNPRLAQILIDCAMNDVIELQQPSIAPGQEFPEDCWYGLVQIATKMGIKTNGSTRVKLGQAIGKRVKELNLERVQEKRLCNGQYEDIWCYRDNEVVRNAIKEWADSIG